MDVEKEQTEYLQNLYKILRVNDKDTLECFNNENISDEDYFLCGIRSDILSNAVNVVTNYLYGNLESPGVDLSCRIIMEAMVILKMDKAGDISDKQKAIYRNLYSYVDIDNYRKVLYKGKKINEQLVGHENVEKVLSDKDKCDDKNEEQLTINRSSVNTVISVCITFEEEKCFLPGFQVRDTNSSQIKPVVINFYDLAVVFDYLSSPTLIVKYLYERALPVAEKRLYIDDELAILGIFTKVSVNLSGILNHPVDEINDGVSNIYFDDSDFAHEIEMHYENNEPKPDFNIHPMLMNLIMEADKQLDNDLLCLLIEILSESQKSLETLFVKFRRGNNSGGFAPQTLRVIDRSETNKEKALVFMKRPSSPFDKKKTLGYLYNRFSVHTNLDAIFVAFFRGDSVELKKYQRINNFFSDPEVQRIGNEMKLSILEHELD